MSQPAPLSRIVTLGICIAALAHGHRSPVCAAPAPARTAVTVYTTTRRPRQAVVAPGEWVLASSRRALWMPYLSEGETRLAFQKHGACIFDLKDGKEGPLLGVRLGTRTGRFELRSAIKRGTDPLTIWCAVESAIRDVPPLPQGRHYTLVTGHVADLHPVGAQHNLSALRLSCARGTTDLTPLAQLRDLKSLWLCCLDSTDLTPLAALSDLTVLHLFCGDKLVDISPLAKLRKLKVLKLHGARSITSIKPLAPLRDLTILELAGSANVADVSPLAGLTNLTWLDLHDCSKITDISALRGLTRLSVLDLGGCTEVADLTPLAGLTDLERLDLSRNTNLRDPAPLAKLAKLRDLNLVRCTALEDLWPLRRLAQNYPCRIAVDTRLRDQLTCVQQALPTAITVANNGKHVISVGMPPEHTGTVEPWVNIADGCIPPEQHIAPGTRCLLYPVHTHKIGSVLQFEWRGPRVLLAINHDPSQLAGVVANTPEGIATLANVLQHATHPLIVWSDAPSIAALPPFPAGRDITLVLMGLATPLEPLTTTTGIAALHIQCCRRRTSDLAPIKHLNSLHTLALPTGPRLTSFEHLAKLNQLVSLNIRLASTVRDLAPLTALARLRTLQIRSTALPDLAPLTRLPQLRTLRLEGKLAPGAIATLGQATGLQVLALQPTGQLPNIAPLANLKALKAISLVDCTKLHDLKPLRALQNLEIVALRACDQIADISPLAALPRLQSLHIHACREVADAETLLTLERRGVTLHLSGPLRRQLDLARETACRTQ